MVNQTIQRFKNEKLLPQKIADGLKITNPKTPKFYISPKIHKPNNSGRPVINSIECHAIRNFKICHHLQSVVKQIPLYIKDTNPFINKVNNFSVPVNSILVTMDMRSLYASIPNIEGIAATNQSTLGSITTEKMSKIPMQFQLANISTSTIMTLTIMKKSS